MGTIENTVTLLNPGKLVFGTNCFEQFIDDYLALGLQRLFIVAVPPVIAQISGKLDILRQKGIALEINDSIIGEPSFDDFEQLLAAAKAFNADSVAGIGGEACWM